jgi:hypothetical protein
LFPDKLIEDTAVLLKASPAAIKAVIEIESSGQPFLPQGSVTPLGENVSGRPVIRFEGHIFWKFLTALAQPDLSPGYILSNNIRIHPALSGERLNLILYRTLKLRPKGITKVQAWDQLYLASLLHPSHAKRSASWGLFQIMGFEWERCGLESVDELVEKANTIEGQFDLFVRYIKARPSLSEALSKRYWAVFAQQYNGPAYADHKYDTKLESAYWRHARA